LLCVDAGMNNLTVVDVLHRQMFTLAETLLRARRKNPFQSN
jgi:hypothetical protein